MKSFRQFFTLLVALAVGFCLHGCTESDAPDDNGKKVKSADCELLSFSLDAEENDLESSIVFEIDQDELTVTATYLPEKWHKQPDKMSPTFSIKGEKVMINDYLAESKMANISFADEIELVVVAENGDKKSYTVILTWPVPKSATCDLLTFSVDGDKNSLNNTIDFTLDQNNLTLKGQYLKWIDNQDPAMMIPTFTTNGVSVQVNEQVVESGVTKISFADDISFVVVAENGDTKTYTISLICPQINTELPVLRLRPDSPITNKDVYVKTKLDMYSPTTTSGWWSSSDDQVEVRGRGNSTWVLPKKPYRIKFPKKFSPIGLDHAKEKSWVLLAHDMDKSLLRNHIGFDFSRTLFNATENYHDPKAIMFTPCSQHVNVYMDNDYHGLYQMSDQMERADGRIAVDKLNASSGTDAEIISGGHIIETDIHLELPPESFKSSKNIQMNHKYPDDDDFLPEQYAYIENFIKEMESVLYGSNFKDPTNGWRKYLDEKTLADYIIIKEFAGDMDGYTSTYMYKMRGVDKLFFGPVWDMDKGWDNDKRVPHSNPLTSLMIHAGFYMPSYVNPDWYHRLWQDENFRKFVGTRWAAKKAELTAVAMKVLDEEPAAMSKSIEANFAVWPFYYQASTEAKMPAKTYKEEIERVRTLTTNRSALLDQLFK